MSDNNGHADDILRKMARIRESLDGDFEGVVREARTLGKWHYYLRRYPLLSVAAALGIGYLIVPRKIEIQAPDEKTLAKLARKQKLVVQPRPAEAAPSGFLSGVVGFLFRLVLNGGLDVPRPNRGEQSRFAARHVTEADGQRECRRATAITGAIGKSRRVNEGGPSH